MVKRIEKGDKKLTDYQFFKLLKESFGYFKTKPFQDKIAQWQLDDNRKMLNRIQTFIELQYEMVFEEIAGKDNIPIESTLIKMIEDRDIIVTDELFIDLIKESPAYLQTAPFKKILADLTIKGNRKMLNRIQTALKPERRGRKATKTGGFKNSDTLRAYIKNVKLISDFKKKHSGEFPSTLNKLFKESYPASNINFVRHHSAKELAYDLTSKEMNIGKRSLHYITKHVHFGNVIIEKIRKP